MPKMFKNVSKTLGLPPGTVVDTTNGACDNVITVFDYDAKYFQERVLGAVEECLPFRETPTVTWINIDGIHLPTIYTIAEYFGIHPLVTEDIANSTQRPKVEDYGDYIYVVLRMMYFNGKVNEIMDEQISVILGNNFVISFQERGGDVFDPIRERIREMKGRVRANHADYLAYALLDAIIDNYYVILEKRSDDIEKLENEIMLNPHNRINHQIHKLKRDMIYLHKQIWPVRELINGLQRNESKLIRKQTLLFLRDAYDHVVQVIDTIESFREMLTGLHESYLSTISNKLNEIMKVLAIFASIFIPLTFIVGIYGMNFEYMPELKWKYGYFVLMGFMASLSVGMLLYFKRRKWI